MKIGITGAQGYLGRVLSAELKKSGHQVVQLGRRANDDLDFTLGKSISIEALKEFNLDGLVHCAYDFSLRNLTESREVNALGTEILFKSAKEAGIAKLLLISSISSFPEAQSIYGKVKFESETISKRYGATIIRPGLIYGKEPGSLLGTLVRIGSILPVLPVFGASAPLYLCHDKSLARTIQFVLEDTSDSQNECITLANPEPWKFADVIRFFCLKLNGTKPLIIPIPWKLVWLGLKSLELIKVPLPIRSDSVLGLVYQNPKLQLEWIDNLYGKYPLQFPLPNQVTNE